MEPIFNYHVLLLFILHLLDHTLELLLGLLHSGLVSLDPNDCNSAVGVRNVDGNIAFGFDLVDSAASFTDDVLVILSIDLERHILEKLVLNKIIKRVDP